MNPHRGMTNEELRVSEYSFLKEKEKEHYVKLGEYREFKEFSRWILTVGGFIEKKKLWKPREY